MHINTKQRFHVSKKRIKWIFSFLTHVLPLTRIVQAATAASLLGGKSFPAASSGLCVCLACSSILCATSDSNGNWGQCLSCLSLNCMAASARSRSSLKQKASGQLAANNFGERVRGGGWPRYQPPTPLKNSSPNRTLSFSESPQAVVSAVWKQATSCKVDNNGQLWKGGLQWPWKCGSANRCCCEKGKRLERVCFKMSLNRHKIEQVSADSCELLLIRKKIPDLWEKYLHWTPVSEPWWKSDVLWKKEWCDDRDCGEGGR